MNTLSTQVAQLLSCPFCGGKLGTFFKHLVCQPATLGELPTEGWKVTCSICRAASGVYPTRTEAIDAWNKREVDPEVILTTAELAASFRLSREDIKAKLGVIDTLQKQITKTCLEIEAAVQHIARLERNIKG